jgi:hypothetical protein
METLDFESQETIRLFLHHEHAPREKMWGRLVAPDLARVESVSAFCDLSFCDVVEVEPVCMCDVVDRFAHYAVCGERVGRGSRRVQAITRGIREARLAEIADYLATWPTLDGSAHVREPIVFSVWSQVDSLGRPVGLVANAYPEKRDTRWVMSFPLDTLEHEIAEFLDQAPYLAFHELMPEDEE